MRLPDAKHAGDVRELKRRLWAKRVMALYEQGYQDTDIARLAGGHPQDVWELRKELHKPNASKSLQDKAKRPSSPKLDTQPEHEKQGKLL